MKLSESYEVLESVAVRLTVPSILTSVTGALLHEPSTIRVIANSARLIRAREGN